MKQIIFIAVAVILLQSCDRTKMQLRAPETSATTGSESKKDTLKKNADTTLKSKTDHQ
nr:hypothetical protein [Pedobacter sp. ASV19]